MPLVLGTVLVVIFSTAKRNPLHSRKLACLAPDVVATLELLETSATAASAAGWSATAAAMTSSSARAGAANWPKNATFAAMSPPASSSRLLAALLALLAALHTKARVGRVVKQRCRLPLCTCLDLCKQFIELILSERSEDPYTAEILILIYATTSSSGREDMRCQY
jgi:hypothetical protein